MEEGRENWKRDGKNWKREVKIGRGMGTRARWKAKGKGKGKREGKMGKGVWKGKEGNEKTTHTKKIKYSKMLK